MISTSSNRNSFSSSGSGRIHDSEIDESVIRSMAEEKLYVALEKDVKEGKSVLLWALQNSGGKKICIVHVHQPAQLIPMMMGGRFPASQLGEKEVSAYRELEKQKMQTILNEYLLICNRVGVRAELLHIDSDSIEKGIVKVILQYGMRRLVMGAAAKKHYSRKMTNLKSKKAIYVHAEAPVTCHIWFVCKGHLIYTREKSLDGVNEESMPTVQLPSPNPETEIPNPLMARSVTLPTFQQNHNSPNQNHQRVMSVNYTVRGRTAVEIFSPEYGRAASTAQSVCDSEASSDEWEGVSRRNFSHSSRLSTCSSNDVPSTVGSISYVRAEGTQGSRDENEIQLLALPSPKDDTNLESPPSVLEKRVDYELYDQLEKAMAEARKSRREAFEESLRRGRAEKDAFDAIRRVKAAESIYNEELKQRKEAEAVLLRERLELEKIQNQRDMARDELQIARDQQSQLENQIAESDETVKELEGKLISAVKLLHNYKKQLDELQIERDNALKVAEDLRQKQAESSSTNSSQFFSEFSFFEIEEATQSFDPSLKIGEGGYGNIYKGLLRHTEVAIKMLNSHSLQGPSEYQQEVDILSKLRHPNLVTLIGVCPDIWALVYEYLCNGSLEDRLNCKDNSPPLSWQTRVRIAAELCSALVFLHSSKPHSIVHGDVKPANVLLDANFSSKLGDFGICRVILPDENAGMGITMCHRSDPMGTFAYMDPELFSSGELTTKSDVYSFGIILLRLLTGKPAMGITKEVQYAIDNENLKSILDYSAGDWPYVQAHQLSHLALRCTQINRKNRPDLGSEVWRVLEAMRASCGGSSSLRARSADPCQAPHYFMCPIFLEVMQDPHVAADGFTYEAESLKGWLDSGHDTSPMTNDKLAHTNLVPNHALRSAIQEWLQRR